MAGVRTIDLTDEHLPGFLVCLEEWNPEAREAGERRRRWYEKMRERGRWRTGHRGGRMAG
jgi:hypothetical protein